AFRCESRKAQKSLLRRQLRNRLGAFNANASRLERHATSPAASPSPEAPDPSKDRQSPTTAREITPRGRLAWRRSQLSRDGLASPHAVRVGACCVLQQVPPRARRLWLGRGAVGRGRSTSG